MPTVRNGGLATTYLNQIRRVFMLLLVDILFFQVGWLARVFDGGQSVPYLASILIILSSCLGSMSGLAPSEAVRV